MYFEFPPLKIYNEILIKNEISTSTSFRLFGSLENIGEKVIEIYNLKSNTGLSISLYQIEYH